jgi:multiple sugar transport system permease protein
MAMQLGGDGVHGVPGEEAPGAAPVAGDAALARRGWRPTGPGSRAEERAAYLFLSPWIFGFVVFLLVPLAWAVWLSFTDEQLLRPGEFIGLDNYVRAFTQDRHFYKSLSVTITWILIAVPLFLVTGLMVALLLNQKLRGMSFFRTLLYVPAVLSGVAIAVLWFTLLNSDLGAVNQVLRSIGIEDPPNWFQDPDWALWGVAIMGLWGVGTNAIIYLAGLQNIPPDLYEAAAMDGAGPWSKFRHITLPLLSPTMFFLFIGELTAALVIIGPVIVISGAGGAAGPADSLLFYMLLLYRRGFVEGELGYAAALAWILTVAGLALVWLSFQFEKRFVYYQA